MNYSLIRNILGKIMILTALLMSISLVFCVMYKETLINYLSFLIPIGLLLLFGWLFNLKKAKNLKILAREGFIIVGLTWLIIALFGCLPFIISGEIPNFFDAFFEIVSGFTTTGASILTGEQAEGLSHSIKFWRTFSHWIGGMGVLVFILALIPESKDGSAVHILRAESPGPQVGKLVSKMQATSRILYLIYLGMTVIEFLLLWLGPDKNMDAFSSLIYSLGTAGTGGFAIHAAGLGIFTPYSQYVISIFMLLFGVNFTLYYFLLIGNFKDVFKNEELRWYICIVISAVLLIFISIIPTIKNVEEAFRLSLFQVGSIISTTGYSTCDYDLWPSLAKGVILIIMFFGACAGSTSGGMKMSRVILLIKSSLRKIKNMVNPRKVEVITFDGKLVNDDTIEGIQSFFIVYCLIFVACALIISIDNHSMLTNITASLACISNIGPGLDVVGPAGNFSSFSSFSKLVLSLEMIAGRLELFPLLILFNPKTWKKTI